MSNPQPTLMQYRHHFEWLVDQGLDRSLLEYVHDVAINRANMMEAPYGVTMADLGFGNLHSVLLLSAHLADVGEAVRPRGLVFENPYEADDDLEEPDDPNDPDFEVVLRPDDLEAAVSWYRCSSPLIHASPAA